MRISTSGQCWSVERTCASLVRCQRLKHIDMENAEDSVFSFTEQQRCAQNIAKPVLCETLNRIRRSYFVYLYFMFYDMTKVSLEDHLIRYMHNCLCAVVMCRHGCHESASRNPERFKEVGLRYSKCRIFPPQVSVGLRTFTLHVQTSLIYVFLNLHDLQNVS